jgi:hypothetical protein
MSPFQVIDAALINSPLGEQIQYSRPTIGSNAAFDAIPIRAIIDTGGEYASPNGTIFADVFLQVAPIAGGPQKGDLIGITNPTPQLPAGSYRVQEIFLDNKLASAHLKVRWTGQ